MTARQWFEKARNENFAIGAFNIDSLEIFKAVILAGMAKKSPVMVEFSPGEVGYFGLNNIVDLVDNARVETRLPILLNLDHGKPKERVIEAIQLRPEHNDSELGFDNVHFDGSDLKLEDNIAYTRDIVGVAHKKGIMVEGEINKVAGSSEVHDEDLDIEKIRDSYTNVEEAKKFVEGTGVDIFAPVFGNLHGTFPVQPDLDIDLLKKIKAAAGQTFLSLHGGSGIPAEQVWAAIGEGVVKINVNTEIRATFKQALEEKLGENPNEYKIYDLMPDVIRAVAAVVEDKIDVFRSAGKI